MRADRAKGSSSRSEGFTLIEMLAAMMILAFGITTVLGVLSSGLATEHNSELIRDASRLATAVREEIEHGRLLPEEGRQLEPIEGGRLPAFPDLKYDLTYETCVFDGREDVVCKVRVRWLRGGSDVSESFQFPLPKTRALYLRIRDELERAQR